MHGATIKIITLVSFAYSRYIPDEGLISHKMLAVLSCVVCCARQFEKMYLQLKSQRGFVISKKLPIFTVPESSFPFLQEPFSARFPDLV